jgi:SPOR domain
MTDSRAALGMDRLPWLTDEPAAPVRRRPRSENMLGWAAGAAVLALAAGSYWLGTRTAEPLPPASSAAHPSAALPLPEPTRVQPGEDIQRVPSPEVRPLAEPEVRRAAERQPTSRSSWRPLPRSVPQDVAERVQRTMATEETERVADVQAGALAKAQPRPVPRPAPVNTQAIRLWPAWSSAGAAGRVVQIGAFGSRQQAKLGWRHMVRAYPGVKRLQAVVVETRNSRGRPFYRFQLGTTSQAHSEVLCQRMERIRFSCAVVGLPGAKRAIER